MTDWDQKKRDQFKKAALRLIDGGIQDVPDAEITPGLLEPQPRKWDELTDDQKVIQRRLYKATEKARTFNPFTNSFD